MAKSIDKYASSDNRTKREGYERVRSALMTERASFETHWRDLADFIKPRRFRAFLTDRNRGDRRNQKIIDSTATFALRTLQSGMHAGMTSPARPWFTLATPDPDLAKFGPVKEWLHDVTKRMRAVMGGGNIYTAFPTLYGDMGLFATGAMSILEDEKDVYRCYNYPVNSYAVGMSKRGSPETFVRDYLLTVRQLIEEFGLESASQTVRNLAAKGEWEQTVEISWIVTPNAEASADRLEAKYLPYSSCWFEKGGNENRFLRESGFEEFPVLVSRWDAVPEDVYGTDCPAITALGDIRALQVETKKKAQALEKMVNPALQGPTHLRNQKVSLLPGDITYVDVIQQQQGIRAIHDISLSIGDVRVDIEDVRFLIRRAFYEDLFLMIAQSTSPEKTAREIEERHEEKLLALGPVLERSKDEAHEPAIDRIYAIMDRAGMIPPPPAELEGVRLKVEYTSILQQAQKLVGITSVDRFVQTTLAIIPVAPEVRHKINWFEVMNEYAEATGIPPRLLIDDEQAGASLEAERQAMAAQAQAAMAASNAKATKDLASAPMDQDSALRRVLEGVSQ